MTVRYRGYLPHVESSNSIYFVTFRLAGSGGRVARTTLFNATYTFGTILIPALASNDYRPLELRDETYSRFFSRKDRSGRILAH
jgi:hypothetical protein